MEHKDDVPYRQRRCEDQPATSADPKETADGITYSVVCPTCENSFTVEELHSVYRLRRTARKELAPPPVPVICECGHPHAGRPPEEEFLGCGSVWQLIR